MCSPDWVLPLAEAAAPGAAAASSAASSAAAATDRSLLSPALVLVLCVVAGIGTLLLLPARREAVLRKIGGVIIAVAGLIFAAMLIHAVGGRQVGHMSVFFWLFSAVAIVGAVRVITHPRPVYSALYFVLAVLASAGLFVLLWAEFMAAALVIIYAGAILVTYVFVIMLATTSAPPGTQEGNEMGAVPEYDAVSREPIAACAVGFTLMGVLLFVIFDRAPAPPPVHAVTAAATQPVGNVQALGTYLFNNQLVNLELSGLILTIAMVGAILIARRQVIIPGRSGVARPEVLLGPATPVDDNPHSIPVTGSRDPREKAFSQN